MTRYLVNCDWGTTHFRLRAVRLGEQIEIDAEFRSADGVGHLAGNDPAGRDQQFRNVLEAGLVRLADELGHALQSAPVMISGMASSSIGWHELPYARVPLRLDGADLIWQELTTVAGAAGPHRVILISGLCTGTDVMRGEETETVGVFQLGVGRALAQDCLLILPGTHSKHIRVERERMVGFQTFMTGEIYSLLSQHSILRHSTGSPRSLLADLSSEAQRAFRAGVAHARRLPLSAALFRVRTRQVLDGWEGAGNQAFLSGVLVGSELAYLADDADSRRQPILLCAAFPLAELYVLALDALSLSPRLSRVAGADVERLTALGQARLWEHLE